MMSKEVEEKSKTISEEKMNFTKFLSKNKGVYADEICFVIKRKFRTEMLSEKEWKEKFDNFLNQVSL